MDPYRLFFPLGAAYGIVGAALWTLSALGMLPYPGELHRVLMIEGFEQCFVAGFLLTALPGLTHSDKAHPAEVGAVFGALVLMGAFALGGYMTGAHVAYAASIGMLGFVALRRLPRAQQPPPVEFMFVGLGLLLGLAGAAMLALGSAGAPPALPPRFGDRLLSLGMMLSLVLGIGGLLVPTFTGMRDPLEIPFIARAHERPPRVAFYLLLLAALVGAFVLEAAEHPMAGAWVRALAGSTVLLFVWKLLRGPGRRDLPAFAMWGAGAFVLAGLWTLVFWPSHPMAGLHVTFIGGFGLLTLAIGTRVVIAHGRHGLPAEPRVLTPIVVASVLAALALRVLAEPLASAATALYGWAGAAWVVGWLAWSAGAIPRIVRVFPPGPVLVSPEARASNR
jgi:uncharacterized protein involved in response to NO